MLRYLRFRQVADFGLAVRIENMGTHVSEFQVGRVTSSAAGDARAAITRGSEQHGRPLARRGARGPRPVPTH